MVTFGQTDGPKGTQVFGEGALLQITLENESAFGAVVSSVDLEIRDHDPSYRAGYATIPLRRGLHLEVPVSRIEHPLELGEQADLDGTVTILDRQLTLDPAGGPTAHHTIDFSVLATLPGLWKLVVRARYVLLGEQDDLHDAVSDVFLVAKT
jgi:hypothetical protein